MASDRDIKVGMRVRFRMPLQDVDGVVEEDRGAIGFGGRRLWRVAFHFDPGEKLVTELPAEELQVLDPSPA